MINTLLIITTYRCNMRCSHCLQGHPSSRADFPLDLLPRLLQEGRQYGAYHVSLTGGELCLHPQFEAFVKTVAEAGFMWNFVTNGQQVDPYLPVIEKYRESFQALTVSLDGASPESHDAIRQCVGAFEQAKKAIRQYVEEGVTVNTTTCLNRNNSHELGEVVKLGEELGVNQMKFAGVIPATHNEAIRLSDTEYLALFERIKELDEETKVCLRKASALYTRGGINFCRMLNIHTLNFNPRGEMLFCCDTHDDGAVIGSLYEKPLAELLEDLIEYHSALKIHRARRIARGSMGNGFDTCSFCNQYYDEVRSTFQQDC